MRMCHLGPQGALTLLKKALGMSVDNADGDKYNGHGRCTGHMTGLETSQRSWLVNWALNDEKKRHFKVRGKSV